MAVAPQWATAFAKAVITNVTDVNTVITAIRTLLTVTLPVGSQWVEAPAQTFTSPADPVSGYTMQLIVARNAALQLILEVNDQNGVRVCNGGVSPTNATQVVIYGGPTHFWCEVPSSTVSGANGDHMGCCIVDPSPEAKNASTSVVATRSLLTNAFATTNVFAPDGWLIFDVNHANPAAGGVAGYLSGPLATGGINLVLKTAGGSELAVPVGAQVETVVGQASHMRHVGLLPQFAWVDKGHLMQSSVVVPIDIGVTGTFDVIGTAAQFSQNNNGPSVLAVRSA